MLTQQQIIQAPHPAEGAATHFAWIATSTEGGNGPFIPAAESAYAWVVGRQDGQVLMTGSNALRAAVGGYQATALFDGAMEMLEQTDIAAGSHLHIFCDIKFFADILNEDRTIRQASNYLQWSMRYKPRKRPLEHSDRWRALDAKFDAITLKVTAGLPVSDDTKRMFAQTKTRADEVRRNLGRRLGDWNT